MYTTCMPENFPTGGYRWLNSEEINQLKPDIDPNGNVGHFFHVDLDLPIEVQDAFKDFVRAPDPTN